VVGVNLEITVCGQLNIEQSMFGDLIEHVIQKRDAGVDGGFSSSINGKIYADLSFIGFSG
jgi:hypothetical protein